MNVTVITPYDSSNIGAFLQAYCLKCALEKLDCDVCHIQTRSAEYVRKLYYKEKPTRKKEKLFRWKFEKKKKYGQMNYEKFLEDQKIFHVISPSKDHADVYVLGSDEIWNIRQPVFRKDVFWGIGLKPAISYATSIGSASIEEFGKYPEQIEAIQKLKTILVRDERTKKMVDQYSSKKAQIVCDPTMLVPVSEYGREFKDDYISRNRCLLIYAYTLKKEEIRAIKQYARKNGLKTVACCFFHDWCDHQCVCSPLEFSSLICQCEAIVTSTFHGSIFSILNHANFVSVPVSPKTSQLLFQFGLESRMLEETGFSAEALSQILDAELPDYSEVEEQISQIRQESMQKLSVALKLACGENDELY